MKKLFSASLLFLMFLVMAACNGGSDTEAVSFSGVSNRTIDVNASFNPLEGVTATDVQQGNITAQVSVSGTVDTTTPGTYELTYTVRGSDGKDYTATRTITVAHSGPPEVIRIMTGAPYEIDPFHESYSGQQQLLKQQKQRAVEAKYNVQIVYEMYPANAPWGPDRVTAIVQSSVSGQHLADVYIISSDWIQALSNGDAIVSIDDYMETHGAHIHPSYQDIGSYRGQQYGFSTGNLTVANGLYYNADLVASLGVANPTQLFLDGEWTWSRMDTWATQVQTAMNALGDDYYALGGVPAIYAYSMIALNGGSLINAAAERVAFHLPPALQTYEYLNSLFEKGVFEIAPQYDAGSPAWQTGKVALHPGSFWFLTAPNRWGNLAFEIGFVPFPVSDTFTGDYVSPISGVSLYTLASGMTPAREELVFQVWSELQVWKTDAELRDEFELILMTRFDQQLYVDAYLEIYDKVYLELVNSIGISTYDPINGWSVNANLSVREGGWRTRMETIQPIYAAALEDYLGD